MNYTIRPETNADYDSIDSLNSRAFGRDNEGKLVAMLRANSALFIPDLSLVALEGNKVVGHILLTCIHI